MASYWVYENWTHKRARVHLAECTRCNNGRGIHPGASARNGTWHGPIAKRDAAYAKAKATGQHNVAGCAFCAP